MDEHQVALNDAFYEILYTRRDAEQHESYSAARPMMRAQGQVGDGFALQREESRLERAVRKGRLRLSKCVFRDSGSRKTH
jgi:hypothetical protein